MTHWKDTPSKVEKLVSLMKTIHRGNGVALLPVGEGDEWFIYLGTQLLTSGSFVCVKSYLEGWVKGLEMTKGN